MDTPILKLLSFRISGKFGHFRKFYTNSSSLSYFLPPRTSIEGILSSILEYGRDSYYDIFHPENIKIGVSISPGTDIKKQMQSVNYLHEKYHKLLVKGGGEVIHSQCKLELIMSKSGRLDYTIYVGVRDTHSLGVLEKLESKIMNENFGFGVYLGQRQFRANIDHLKAFQGDSIVYINESEHIDSLCMQDNAEPDLDYHPDLHIVIDQMPIHMQKETVEKRGKKRPGSGRKLQKTGRVIYEKSGKRIFGKFRNCYKIDDKVISFYE